MTTALGSWSRRRAAVAAEAAAERAACEAAEAKALEAAQAERTDAEILAELNLPDPDTLSKGDDFSAFMAKAVPQHLRRRALRRLWRSDPVLACLDGLNDYDDDYLTGSFGQGPVSTTYQVGKGLMAHVLEVERLAKAALEETPEATAAAIEETPEAEPEDTAATAEAPAVEEPEAVATAASEIEEAVRPAPRRMQFRFEGTPT